MIELPGTLYGTVLASTGLRGSESHDYDYRLLPPSENSCPTNKVNGVLIGCLLVILP